MKNQTIVIFLIPVLVACNPFGKNYQIKKAVDQFLKSNKENNLDLIHQYRCVKDDVGPNVEDFPISNAKKWEIDGYKEEQKAQFTKYNVVVNVTLKSNNSEYQSQWLLGVWKSDDIYERGKQVIGKTDEVIEESKNLIESLGGDTSEINNNKSLPDRSDYSEKLYCISNVERLE